MIEGDFAAGTVREVQLHDGSIVLLKKLERDYDPTNRTGALNALQEAHERGWLITGLIYIDTTQPTLAEVYQLPDEPLNRLASERLRPAPETIAEVNQMMF